MYGLKDVGPVELFGLLKSSMFKAVTDKKLPEEVRENILDYFLFTRWVFYERKENWGFEVSKIKKLLNINFLT